MGSFLSAVAPYALFFLLVFRGAHADEAPNALSCGQQFQKLTRDTSEVQLDEVPPLPKTEAERAAYGSFLKKRLGINPEEIDWSGKYPVVVRGSAEAALMPKADFAHAVVDPETYDVVVVGAGPSGLTSGAYLTKGGAKVLMLDQAKEVGGVTAGGVRGGIQYARGAAYATDQEKGSLMARIYNKDLGLRNFHREFAISHSHDYPIDSFLWNGRYYRNWWEDEKVLGKLPASFAVFKHVLKTYDKNGWIASTPFRGQKMLRLDSQSMADFVRGMPAELREMAGRGDKKALALLRLFNSDAKVNRAAPMEDVLGILQLYGRSALGDHPEKISAQAFASFYVAELGERYTSNIGAGFVAKAALDRMKEYGVKNGSKIQLESGVAQIRNVADGVEVFYVHEGKTHLVRARKAIAANPLNISARIIKDYEKIAPGSHAVATNLEFANYSVINVHTKGHSWTDTYDLWVRDDRTYSKQELTDIIDGRWMDYVRNPIAARHDDRGILTIYKPMPDEHVGSGFDTSSSVRIANEAVDRAKELIKTAQAASARPQKEVEVLAVEVNRWPYSIHKATPGHLTKMKELEKPIGNVYLANNNMGVPAVEEGVYRGYDAARRILKELKKGEGKIPASVRKSPIVGPGLPPPTP